jgi:hypothetical protein
LKTSHRGIDDAARISEGALDHFTGHLIGHASIPQRRFIKGAHRKHDLARDINGAGRSLLLAKACSAIL